MFLGQPFGTEADALAEKSLVKGFLGYLCL
jgi:hypothetical protein